jgi:3-oxoacyl-[acyl-carrier protein] reductase
MAGRLAGRRAIVTGAAAGIGRAIAQRFLAEGARVLAVDRAAASLETLRGDAAAGDRLNVLTVDLTDEVAPDAVVNAALAALGGLDILVNNAGIGGSMPVADLPDDDWRRMIDTNLTAVFRLTKHALPALSRTGAGRVINIASVFGLVGFRGSSSYAAAKAGVAALTRSVAIDYAGDGITANAIAPGLILTAMSQRNLDAKPWFRGVMYDATPIRRMGTPEDVAGCAAFLASDDAAFITGQTIAVDGGWSTARFQAEGGA